MLKTFPTLVAQKEFFDKYKIKTDVILAKHTSMFVGGPAKYFVVINSIESLKEILQLANKNTLKTLILGKGCNTLIADGGFDGLVIKINVLGREKKNETDDYVEYKIGAGEVWDDFVKLAVENYLYGIENMSHVPGSVGASVVQNIGCYGQEVGEAVMSVEVLDINSLKVKIFNAEEINFAYRQSRFNDESQDKNKYVITAVTYRLKKTGQINSDYGDVQKYFKENNVIKPDLQTLRQALITIRNNKFPYPNKPEQGTCGSFFKAEVVDENNYQNIINKLQNKGLPDQANYLRKMMTSFKVAQGYKVPYGLLIESLGFKGKIRGGAKILESHAGVINNYTGQARAQEVYDLAQEVIKAVGAEYGVIMRVEPEIVGDFAWSNLDKI